ncbi:MAG: acetylornithine deacetylase [bacterium]|nr:acetylornithine deacetylase [bacterium]
MTAQEILAKLVSFPVLGGESNLTIINWIKDFVEQHGVEAVMVPNEEGTKASLHCRIGPALDGGVILSGHTDVVPVKGQNWETDPFELVEKSDGKLYARGSCDMKGFLACCLSVLPDMVKADLKTPIYFAFSYDEEIGCLAAPELIEHIKSHYSEMPKYAIIGEATMLQPVIGQKGMTILETTVNGSAGHSSRILQEVSAVHEASRLVLWIEDKMKEIVGSGSQDERFEPPHTSLHVGMINGGIAANIISDKVTIRWDVRVIPKDDFYAIKQAFEDHCREREQELRKVFPDFEIKTIEDHPPVPPLDTSEADDIVDLTRKITGNTEVGAVSYAAEAGQFSLGGFQSIICGPGDIAQAHRANEFISKEQLEKGVEMIRKLVEELS